MDSHSNKSIQLSKYSLAILVIVLFGAFLRLYNLDYMAFHHDESIHAKYSWFLYQGNEPAYRYDPVYHGPFLYHFGALHFVLFGDSDTAARLPFAFAGILMLYFVWRLKPWIGSHGVFFTLLFVTLSPVLSYFSRFARNDIYMGTAAMGIILFALEYLRSKKTSDLVWMSFFLVLMYTIKENSYMTGFFFGSFIVMYGAYYIFSYPKEARSRAVTDIFEDRLPFAKIAALYGIFSVFAFTYVYYGTHNSDFKMKLDEARGSDPVYAIHYLRTAWNHFLETHPSTLFLWLAVFIPLTVITFFGFTFIQKYFGRQKENEDNLFIQIARHNIPVLLSLLVILSVYSFLFTTMGTNKSGMYAGVVDYLLYWMGQQGNPRIPGPPTYFLPRLGLYEALPVLASIFAFIIYLFQGLKLFNFLLFIPAFGVFLHAFGTYAWYHSEIKTSTVFVWLIILALLVANFLVKQIIWKLAPILQNIEETVNRVLTAKHYQPDGYRMFLIYWTVFSILIYGMLEEKVPWLLVHQALPLCLLAGVFIGDTWKQIPAGIGRQSLIIIIAVLSVYQMRTSIILNFYNPDDPRETMVYTQSSHMTKLVVKEIEEAAERMGADYMPPNPKPNKPIAATIGEAGWPYAWYLRHYTTSHYGNVDNSLPPHGIPFVIGELQHQDRLELWAKGGYTVRRFKHQVWWPYGQSELPFNYITKTKGKKISDAFGALSRYVLYREMWDKYDPMVQPGSKDFLLFRKTPMLEPLEMPEAPPGFDQPPTPLRILQQTGSLGAGPGQFNKPRGIALSPDESKIYVLDGMNCRIQVFDQSFNHIQTIGGPGEGPGQFTLSNYSGPNGGISVAPDGKIYATDTWYKQFGRINVYNPDGTPAQPILRAGVGSFFAPRALIAAPDNRIYVSDTGNHQVIWFDQNGNFGGTVVKGLVNEPVGVAMGPSGMIYVCDVENKRVASFTTNGQSIKQMQIIGWKANNPGDVNWIEPYVALNRQGFTYVTDSTTNSIYRFDPSGNTVSVGKGGLNKPKGIAVDSQNNIYVADSDNNRILKLHFP